MASNAILDRLNCAFNQRISFTEKAEKLREIKILCEETLRQCVVLNAKCSANNCARIITILSGMNRLIFYTCIIIKDTSFVECTDFECY